VASSSRISRSLASRLSWRSVSSTGVIRSQQVFAVFAANVGNFFFQRPDSHEDGLPVHDEMIPSFVGQRRAMLQSLLSMSSLDAVLVQLKQERDSLSKAISALESIAHNGTRTKRTMSVSARKRIAAAQRLRWAKWKRQNKRVGA
jgi:hypothetical protein